MHMCMSHVCMHMHIHMHMHMHIHMLYMCMSFDSTSVQQIPSL
jgi:hypothetical protein